MRISHLLVSLGLSVTIVSSVAAQGPMRVVPSGRGTTEVSIQPVDSAARANSTPSTIRIDYGQPHLRGRKLLTDSLIPYDTPWRTGANAPTTLTTDVDLVVGGKTLPKGKYVLQTLPSRNGWKLLVQNEVNLPPGAPAPPYDPSKDIAQIDLRQTTLATPLESLTIWLIPTIGPGNPKGELVLAWGNFSLATTWSMK
jgi:hypothetical protein